MKLIILAFILSLSLHFLFFSSLEKKEEIKQSASTSKKINKSSITYVKLMPRSVQKQTKREIKKPELKKTKPKNYKVVDKKKIVPQKKKPITKKAKKIIPKPVKKVEVKPTPTKQIPKKVEIKPQEKRKTIKEKSLENYLLEEPLPLDMNMLDDITKEYLRAYGKEYNSFTNVQKVFLQNNLNKFTRITQRVLTKMGYPRLAARLKLSGMNFVEFIFHPNGDISDLKITLGSGYKVFDKYTLELIEIAYKEYPRPKEATKIKFKVTYRAY